MIRTVGPSWGATVMATGIVSAVLWDDGLHTASIALMGIASALWTASAVALAVRAACDRARMRREARAVGSLTAVAGTSVLGTRLAMQGWPAAAAVLLACAAATWPPLMVAVLRWWRQSASGEVFLIGVSTEGIAVLCATLGGAFGAAWLAAAGAIALVAGVGLYVFALASFHPIEVWRGRGDQWVAGGALAISALAASDIDTAASSLGGLAVLHAPLRNASLVLWGLAIAWLPLLIVGELHRLRPGYDARRWATVFPLGMYAAMSFAVARTTGYPWIARRARCVSRAARSLPFSRVSRTDP